MADNTTLDAGAGGVDIATDELTYSGDTAHVQVMRPVVVTGSEGSKTLREYVKQDDTAFTPGTDAVAMAGAEFDDTTPDSVDEGDAGALRMAANRVLYVTIRDAAGNERGMNIDANGDLAAVLAAGSATIGEVTIGAATTAAGDLAKAEDAIHASGDVGVQALAVRNDAVGALAGTDGDYAPLQVSATGALYTDGSDTTQPVSGTVTANAGTGTMTVDGSGVTQPISGTVTANAGTGTMTVDGSGVTQPVSGTVTANITDTSFAVADGNALGEGVLVQGDDGTDRKNINVDAATGDVQVDVTNTVTVDGSGVTQPVSGTVTANAGTGTMTVDGSGVTQPVSGTVTANAGTGTMTVDGSGVTQPVSGTVTANAGTGTMTVDNGGAFVTQATLTPATSGGLSFYRDIDLDETAVAVKAGAGQIYGIFATNTNAAVRFLQVYNVAQGSVTVGTTVADMTYQIPPDNGGLFLNLSHGIAMSTAITIAATTGVSDAGAPGTNEVLCTVLYK